MRLRSRWTAWLGLAAAMLFAALLGGPTGGRAAEEFPPLGPLPDIEPQNPDAVELGKHLFFDNRISGDADRKCSDCHIPSQGWGDGKPLSTGYPGTEYFRNAKTVLNAMHAEYFYWDGRLDGKDPETQVRDTITESHFHAADGRIMLERLQNIPEYVELFEKALGGEPSFGRMLKAISAFEKTLVSTNVPFDNYVKGDKKALSAKAQQGLELFQGKAGCIQCHNGPYFSDHKAHNLGVPQNPDIFLDPKRHVTFRSVLMFLGMPNYYNLRYDPGHFAVTKNPKDLRAFVTPTLREVSRTAPYMHNGMLPTLESVVDFYDKGGGKDPKKDPALKPLKLTAGEKEALVEFLKSLAGDEIKIEIAKEDLPQYQPIADWYEVKN